VRQYNYYLSQVYLPPPKKSSNPVTVAALC
jgi:hypothetical protein